METEPPFSDLVERFLSQTSMPPATFGREAMNDPHFIRDLRAGRRLWPETEARVRSFMDGYAPAQQAAAA